MSFSPIRENSAKNLILLRKTNNGSRLSDGVKGENLLGDGCVKLMKTAAGEVAEWPNAAVC
jgi:hypothetical protein